MNKLSEEQCFDFDLYRTILLSKYVSNWGVPEYRTITQKEKGLPVEIYSFPGGKDELLVRYATVGIAKQFKEGGAPVKYEILMVLPKNLGGANDREVTNYIFDIMAYSLRDDVTFEVERTIPSNDMAPKAWRQRAILIDTPHAEHEDVQTIMINNIKIELRWVLPIYKEEADNILKHGIEWFGDREEDCEWSVVDLARDNFGE